MELCHSDTPLLRFRVIDSTYTAELEITWINKEKQNMLPLDLELSNDGLYKWLKRRVIPRNRAFVHSFLSKCGLNLNRPLSIIHVSKGLSLNDCYWVVEEGFEGSFAKYNLYDNRFSQILALIAFTGYGSSIRTSLASCSTRAVPPGPTAPATSPIPSSTPPRSPRLWASTPSITACPSGRGSCVPPAPLFDHGNALFNFAGRDALASEEGLNAYADTLMPCVYDDFFETAKKVMTDEHRAALRHLLTFRFKRHSRYNLPPERLKLIEKMVRSRARKLLE